MPIFEGLSYREYENINAVRWSTLKEMEVSPAHYRWCLSHPRQDTPALALGRAVHTALLEPSEFYARYALWAGGTRRGSDWERFKSEFAYKEGILTADEFDECEAMAVAVRRNRDARRYVTSGRSEVTIVWTDKATGLRLKARVDRLSTRGRWYINAKTAKTIDPRRFGYQAADLLYYAGLAFTYGGLATMGLECAAKLVVVDKSDEHDCAVFDVGENEMFAGEAVVGRLLGKLAECKRSRRWPGRYSGEQTLQLPSWCYGEEQDVSGLNIDFGEVT
jgi:hypothetical protein